MVFSSGWEYDVCILPSIPLCLIRDSTGRNRPGPVKKEGIMPTILHRSVRGEIAAALNIAAVLTVIAVALATLIS